MCRSMARFGWGLVLVLSIAMYGTAHATIVLYGVASGFGTGDGTGGGTGTGPGTASQFHRIDTATGAATEISSNIGQGSGSISALAASADNTLYSVGGGTPLAAAAGQGFSGGTAPVAAAPPFSICLPSTVPAGYPTRPSVPPISRTAVEIPRQGCPPDSSRSSPASARTSAT